MTREEAAKIVKIMLTADGWCSSCQSNLIGQFQRAFPEHEELAAYYLNSKEEIYSVFYDKYDDWLGDSCKGEEPRVWEIEA